MISCKEILFVSHIFSTLNLSLWQVMKSQLYKQNNEPHEVTSYSLMYEIIIASSAGGKTNSH